MTDQEVEEKFAALADGVLSKGAQKRVKEAIWNLERIGSVSELMAMMKAEFRKAGPVKVTERTYAACEKAEE